MKRKPHPAVCVPGVLIGLVGFVVLASEAWSEAKIAMFWQSGAAVVTGFREKGRPHPLQESLTVVFVRTSLPDGRQVPGFTVNDRWRLRNWPQEAVPRQLGDPLAVYVDPRNARRVVPKHEVDPLGLGLFAIFFGLVTVRSAIGLMRLQRGLDEVQRSQ